MDGGLLPLLPAKKKAGKKAAAASEAPAPAVAAEPAPAMDAPALQRHAQGLHFAAGYGTVELVRAALNKAPDRAAAAREADHLGQTALHFASKNGHTEVMALLLDEGADARARTSDHGMEPLHWACSTGRVDAAHVLLERGASIASRDARGATPLIVASQSGHAALAAFLLKRGADPSDADCEGDTAVSWAAYNGMAELLSMLAAAGAALDVADVYGMRPVHLAAQQGMRETVEALVDLDVDLTAVDAKGRTPADLAAEQRHAKVARFLRRAARRPGGAEGWWERWCLQFGGGEGRTRDDGRRAVYFYGAQMAAAMALWYAVLVPAVPELFGRHLWYVCAQGALLACWYKACRTPPGAVQGEAHRRMYEAAVEEIARTADEGHTVSLCHTCRVRRPPRSKHCRELKQCVLRFDHYCPFIDNAVGLNNQVYFFGTILSTAAASMAVAALTAAAIWRLGATVLLVAALVNFGFFAVTLSAFTLWHAYLISKNVTTNEYINRGRYAYVADPDTGKLDCRYSRGLVRNWSSWVRMHDDTADAAAADAGV